MLPRAQSHRLRNGRVSEPNRIYLITFICFQRKRIFEKFECGRVAVRGLRQIKNDAQTLCFVVMPDHVHWLMQLQLERDLSCCVQKLKGNITRELHSLRLVDGRIWESSFHDRALRREEDLLNTARYVVANPLRAGLVNSLRDYPHWDAMWL